MDKLNRTSHHELRSHHLALNNDCLMPKSMLYNLRMRLMTASRLFLEFRLIERTAVYL